VSGGPRRAAVTFIFVTVMLDMLALGMIIPVLPALIKAFRGGDTRRVALSYDALEVEEKRGDPELDRIRQAMREVLGDHGWIDVEIEMAPRWTGGTLRLIPGKAEIQAKDVPIEVFFKKIVAIRDRLRVLEQKVNAHATLAAEEKLELQGYITRCYGSLTTFNVLFASEGGRIQGESTG